MSPRTRLYMIVALVLGPACSDEKGAVAPSDKIPCRTDAACAPVFPNSGRCEEPACVEGFCELTTLADGTFCNDGQRCTEPDSCRSGVCGGTPVACDDQNQCTEDFCDPKEGCVFDALVATCDDGDPCTDGDVCSNKACLPGQPIADCCLHDAECDDLDLCTDDHCTDHACAHDANEAPCNDQNPCTKIDRCSAGDCVGSELLSCEDGFSCTLDECDVATGLCRSATAPDGVACDDRNPCTSTDACQAGLCIGSGDLCECTTDAHCVPFEDADLCNGTLVCEAYVCTIDPSTIVTCGDSGASCSQNTCDTRTGQCTPTATVDGSLCDDQNRCSLGDSCRDGVCSGVPDPCDDGNPCTFDQCSPDTGCVHTNHALPCDDGVPCTVNDTCGDGTCAGTALDCDDDNPCTNDGCTTGQCTHTNNTVACDDLNACTSGEKCGGGACGGGTVLCECQNRNDCASSEDGNLCNGTLECVSNKCVVDPTTVVTCSTVGDTTCKKTQCHSASGQCVKVDTANGTGCNDASACTSPDTCTAGVCGGPTVNCNDQNPCTNDACNVTTGCTHVNNTTGCNDNNACTQPDVCSGGFCSGGIVNCDDGNPCTSDSCNATSGCVHAAVANGTSCPDGNLCNGNESCQSGQCTNDLPLACNDNNVCTSDSCAPATGCVHSALANGTPCLDADACDGSESCFGGACNNGAALVCNDGDPCTIDDCAPTTGCFTTPSSCNAPVPVCGVDVTTEPRLAVTLTGSASDPDGGAIVSYAWTVTSRPNGSVAMPTNPSSPTTTFTPDLEGVYELTITFTDNEGETASCSIFVTAVFANKALRIELVWNTIYGDADLHLIRPGVSVAASWFHADDDCWFGNTNANKWPPNGTDGNASLDRDDYNGYGPENITLPFNPAAGVYTIGVEYYCSHSLVLRGGKPDPDPLGPGDGPATGLVRIHCGTQPVIEIPGLVLDQSGRFIIVGTITVSNTPFGCTVNPTLTNTTVSALGFPGVQCP